MILQQQGSHETPKTSAPRETKPAAQPNQGDVERYIRRPEQQ
jgi:hypothetical protein